MKQTPVPIKEGDWIRFQLIHAHPEKTVVEGFVQEVAPDGTKLRIGKASFSPESQWYNLSEITVIKQQQQAPDPTEQAPSNIHGVEH